MGVRGLILVLCVAACGGGGDVASRSVEGACLEAGRSPGAARCQCAAAVAGQTLSREDRRKTAEILADPDAILPYTSTRATPAQAAFLERYRNWARTVARICS